MQTRLFDTLNPLLQDYLQHTFGTDDIWSDFKDGSNELNYFNGALVDAKQISEMGMGNEIWDPSDTQTGQCTKMASASQYRLKSVACSGEAKYICVKPGINVISTTNELTNVRQSLLYLNMLMTMNFSLQ